jgi:hypothetical protein
MHEFARVSQAIIDGAAKSEKTPLKYVSIRNFTRCPLIAINASIIMLPGIRTFRMDAAQWGLKAGDIQSMKCAIS